MSLLATTAIAHELGVHPGTICRWILTGVLRGDERIYLTAIRAGRRWRVQQSDLDRFLIALTSSDDSRGKPKSKLRAVGARTLLTEKYGFVFPRKEVRVQAANSEAIEMQDQDAGSGTAAVAPAGVGM